MKKSHHFKDEKTEKKQDTLDDYRHYYEIIEAILLDYLFILNRRSRMCISLHDFWEMDTYTLYEFLSKEYQIMAEEEKQQKELEGKNKRVKPKHENNPEMEKILGNDKL